MHGNCRFTCKFRFVLTVIPEPVYLHLYMKTYLPLQLDCCLYWFSRVRFTGLQLHSYLFAFIYVSTYVHVYVYAKFCLCSAVFVSVFRLFYPGPMFTSVPRVAFQVVFYFDIQLRWQKSEVVSACLIAWFLRLAGTR